MVRCLSCTNTYDYGRAECPHCGYSVGTPPNDKRHMFPGTILNNRYIIGKVVGSGGFGVTYIAWDDTLQRRVAIKEYFPNEFSRRGPNEKTVSAYDEGRNQYLRGRQRFFEEAQNLARFQNEPGIVKIYDSFFENETAYIVMEYLEGETLKSKLKREKKISAEKAIKIALPIMKSLEKIHESGIIHRDISPDNIMITTDGNVKLIDFGAAKYITTTKTVSFTVLLKKGYAPIEQYGSGEQGKHTDVYSMGAVLYKMITGETPPDSMERKGYKDKKKEKLKPLCKFDKNISENIENAILNAMNIDIKDRTKDMKAFMKELYSEKNVKRRHGKLGITRGWPVWAKVVVPLSACAVITLGLLFLSGVIKYESNLQSDIIIPEGMTRVPSIVNTYLSKSETALQQAQLMYTFEEKQESDIIPKDYVLWQSENPGKITAINSEISIIVSAGPSLIRVESVEGYSKEEAIKILEKTGFIVSILEEYDDSAVAGDVISQSIAGGEYVAKSSEILLSVSKGRNPETEFKEEIVKVPDFVGKTYDEARALATEYGLVVSVSERKYSSEYARDIVMAQNVSSGTEVSNKDIIKLSVSKGKELVRVPDVTLMTKDDARKILELEGFVVVEKEPIYDENVKAGSVISQSFDEGEMIEPGATIEILVSKGRESFEMPDVVNMKINEAEKILIGKGLSMTVSYRNSDSVTSGCVISQSIGKGASVMAGISVGIVVSSGEELFQVPNVINKDEKTAIDTLEKLNFKVRIVEAYDEEVDAGKVIAQSLLAGTQHKKKTDIIITVSKGKEPLKVTFDANGGSGTTTSTLYKGDKYILPNAPQKNGYIFNGWYTAKSGGTKVTVSTMVESGGNQTLYAQWTAISYIIQYNGNGATSGSTLNSSHTYDVDKVLSGNGYSRTYYNFNGWNTKADGSGIPYNDGQNVSNLSTINGDKIILYAQWNANSWSSWSDTLPNNVNSNDYKIETQTKYSYRDKSFTESSNSNLEGWTVYDNYISYTDWVISEYTSIELECDDVYRKLVNTKTVVDCEAYKTYTIYRYKYWNTTYNAYYYTFHSGMGGTYSSFTVTSLDKLKFYSDVSNQSGVMNYTLDGYMYTFDGKDGCWFISTKVSHTPMIVHQEYQYATRNQTFIYKLYKWSDWSEYSTTVYTASSTREVQTKKYYRYIKK